MTRRGITGGDLFVVYSAFYFLSLIYLMVSMFAVGRNFRHRDQSTIIMIVLTLIAGAITLTIVRTPAPALFLTFGAVLLVIWRHRSNIARLVAGTEKKFSFRKKKQAPPPEPGEAPTETTVQEPSPAGEEQK